MSRIALVTGGTRGIGAAICVALKNANYQVVANYAHNSQVAEKFNQKTGIATYKWDVSNFEECKNAVAKITSEVGNIDILVNNAGITRDAMMHKLSAENWGQVIDTNLNSCFFMSQTVISGMRERQFGRIINISSINGQAGQMGQTNYSAAKAGVFGFTKALALETARKNITVNAIAPGYINTSMTKDLPPKIMDNLISKIPVGRFGEPEEIARCALFLADDAAGFLTGETISVNGGHYME